jgi:hypothetical protein
MPGDAGRERGAASLEFALLLPFVALTFSLLIGMGYTLSSKQHAMMAARFATYSYAERGVEPTVDQINQAAYQGIEVWTPERTETTTPFAFGEDVADAASQNLQNAGIDIDETVTGMLDIFNSIFDALNIGTPRVDYRTTTPADRGMVAYIAGGSLTATGTYALPKGTWTCAQIQTPSYLGWVLGRPAVETVLEIASFGAFDTHSEECCNNYTGS